MRLETVLRHALPCPEDPDLAQHARDPGELFACAQRGRRGASRWPCGSISPISLCYDGNIRPAMTSDSFTFAGSHACGLERPDRAAVP